MSRADIWDFWAPRYDRLWVQRVSLGPTRDALRAQLSRRPPGRLLDLGCGTGQLLEAGGTLGGGNGWTYLGLDTSRVMLAEARRKHPTADFRCADVMSCDVAPGGFDMVVCAHAFPYLPDQPAALARMAGWLRPGGRLLLAQACTENLYDRAVLAFVRLTTPPARYLSVTALCTLARPLLGEPREVAQINRHAGVPSICLVVWERPVGGPRP